MSEVKTDDSRFVEYIGYKKIQGEVFGDWEAIGYLGPKTRKWACRCTTCGIEKDIAQNTLLRGIYAACLHGEALRSKKVKVGDVYGEFTVIGETVNYRALCRCSCGKEKLVNVYHLQAGRSTSCGHTMNQDRVVDLTGQKFNKLTVLRYLGEQKWECRCDCGNITVKHRNKLLAGISKSCGKCTGISVRDLRGQKFGKLTPLRYVENKSWQCICDCGTIKDIRAANLVNGSTISCGCVNYEGNKDDILETIGRLTVELERKPKLREIADVEGVNKDIMAHHIKKLGINLLGIVDDALVSEAEIELRKFIQELIPDEKLVCNDRVILNPYELDIYIKSRNIAVEYNGDYWHSDINKHPNYHQEKTISCAKKGIRLIHVFEHEWINKETRVKIESMLKDLLLPTKIIYARKTILVIPSKEDMNYFMEENHLSGSAGYRYGYALADKETGELLQAITLGSPRFSDKGSDTLEIIRMATKSGITVVGGLSKLMANAKRELGEVRIITYVDIAKFTGNGYLRAGFTTEKNPITKPGYFWIMGEDKLTRYQTMKHKLVEQGLGTEEQTEDEIMYNLGYYKVYNSGNIKLVYNK